jgi:hypothetical protein
VERDKPVLKRLASAGCQIGPAKGKEPDAVRGSADLTGCITESDIAPSAEIGFVKQFKVSTIPIQSTSLYFDPFHGDPAYTDSRKRKAQFLLRRH